MIPFLFRTWLIVGALALVTPNAGQAQNGTSSDSFTLYLFLLEDCKITQAYTDKIRYLHGAFGQDSIGFVGYFPNPVSEDSTIAAFSSKYLLPFFCTRKQAYERAKTFDVRVTPEVVLYNETEQTILYQGRIDNLFERVGQRRQVVTSHELEAALNAVRRHQAVPIPKTHAVGCIFK